MQRRLIKRGPFYAEIRNNLDGSDAASNIVPIQPALLKASRSELFVLIQPGFNWSVFLIHNFDRTIVAIKESLHTGVSWWIASMNEV